MTRNWTIRYIPAKKYLKKEPKIKEEIKKRISTNVNSNENSSIVNRQKNSIFLS